MTESVLNTNLPSFAAQKMQLLNEDNYKNLIEMFELACRTYQERPAFNCIGQNLSFTELDEFSGQFSAYLTHELGLKKGDRIAIQLPNLNQYPIVAWGAMRSGLILVNTNPLYTERELLHQFNDSGVTSLVVLADLLPGVESIINSTSIENVIVTNVFDMYQPQPKPESSITGVITLPEAFELGKGHKVPVVELTMDDVAVLQYTGGTTGVSKGAILTHGNIFAGNKMSALMMDDVEPTDEVVIAPMPLYHVYGFTMNVVGVLLGGGLSVLIPDPRDIGGMINTMKQFKFTGMAAVNTLFIGMLRHPDFDDIDFSQCRGAIAGGAALVPEIAQEWSERTGNEIFEGYGLSETTSVLTCNSPEFRRLGTVGKVLKHLEVRVVDGEGHVVAPDREGELQVRGAHIMKGYWNRDDETREAIDSDGWFSTGDIVVIGKDGFIKIVDRKKDMILVSGFNVYPNEIEAVLYEHADVVECAVVGVKSDRTGEALKAYIVPANKELTAKSLEDHCRQSLTSYKIPRLFEFVETLPKSNVGKILRRELR